MEGAAFVSGDGVFLQSRSFKALAAYFPDVVEHLAGLPTGTVLDGELIFFDATADRTSFSALQRRVTVGRSLAREVRARPVSFVAFDLPHDLGGALRDLPLGSGVPGCRPRSEFIGARARQVLRLAGKPRPTLRASVGTLPLRGARIRLA